MATFIGSEDLVVTRSSRFKGGRKGRFPLDRVFFRSQPICIVVRRNGEPQPQFGRGKGHEDYN